MCLILLPGSVVRSGLHISPFFTVSRMWFLLVRLACLAMYKLVSGTGLATVLHRLVTVFFPLREVAKPGHGLSSISLCKRCLCQGLVVPLWLRGLTVESGIKTHPAGKKSAGGSVSTSSADARKNGYHGGQHS